MTLSSGMNTWVTEAFHEGIMSSGHSVSFMGDGLPLMSTRFVGHDSLTEEHRTHVRILGSFCGHVASTADGLG